MIQIETRVSSQVQLLELWGQILWEGDLAELITAQIHTLTKEEKMSVLSGQSQLGSQRRAAATGLLSSPSAA